MDQSPTDTRWNEQKAVVPQPGAGELIISEIMYNPSAVDDNDGEWFELFNPTTETVSLVGLTLSDAVLDEQTTNQVTFTREA